MTIKVFKGNKPAEIYSSGCRMAWLTPKNEMCHQWVFCKDFLQDAVAALRHDTKAGIYGFYFDPKVNPHPDIDYDPRIAVTYDDTPYDLASGMNSSVALLNYFEQKWGWKKSTVTHEKDEPISVFHLSPNWIAFGPVMLSLCTTLIRQGVSYTGSNLEDVLSGKLVCPIIDNQEQKRLASVTAKIPEWWNKLSPYWFNVSDQKQIYDSSNISNLHNYSGYLTFFTGSKSYYIDKAFPEMKASNDPTLKQIYANAG